MRKSHLEQGHCIVCGKAFSLRKLVPFDMVRDTLSERVLRDHPEWAAEAYICRNDLARYNADYVESVLQSERGELSGLEHEVLESLRQHELLSMDVDLESEKTWTFGERLADRLADFAGSWTFLICFAFFMAAWIAMNSLVMYRHPVDPYPFILLNLLLSCLAAIQAPIIMMSQNRQEARDRLRAQHDYQVNLKAELEIRHLNEKLDHLLSRQWERLVQIQKLQIDMLSELSNR